MTLSAGAQLHEFAARLYPICRSISGAGVRQTLALIADRIPLKVHEIRSGSRVFDWQVPLEWNIEDASVSDPDGKRVVDFQAHNLHLVSYSEPVSAALSLEELAPHLHSSEQYPDSIPYRTSYYRRSWGFCMRDRERKSLLPGTYSVRIDSSLAPGSLTYGETVLRGRSREEVVIFAHVCHPSLANDNTSGLSVSTALAQWIGQEKRHYTYRFVFAPATIGALCWLKQNEHGLRRIRHGLVLALLGDPGPLTYKASRRGASEIDSVASYVLAGLDSRSRVIPFTPYGYDERQLCSPGFDLPVGRLTRSVNGGYPEYHTSADDMSFITGDCLQQSYEALQRIVTVLEGNGQYVNLSPKGEPQLGKRGLYGSVGGRVSLANRESALLWVLNQSDGSRSLLDIARHSAIDFDSIHEAAAALRNAGLLRLVGRGRVAIESRAKSAVRTVRRTGSESKGVKKSSRKRQRGRTT
jgi:aminopeptidase-like protein